MGQQKSIQSYLFSVLHQISSTRPHQLLPIMFTVLYMVQLLFSLPFLVDTNNNISSAIFTSSIFFLTIITVVSIITLELLLAIFYRVQAQLYLQLVFYRFVVFPSILLFLTYQIEKQIYFSALIAKITFFIIGALTYFANFIIHSYVNDSIFRIFESSSNWLVVTDCLLFAVGAMGSFSYTLLVLLSIAAINMLVRYKLKDYDFNTKNQQVQYFTLNIKDVIITILLARELILAQINSLILIVLAAPLILCIVIIESSRNNKKRKLNGQVFKGNTTLRIFFDFASSMNKELFKFKNNQDQDLQYSLLLVFIAIHKQKCVDSACLLSQKSTQQQIKNGNSSNNLKIIKYKIIKKLQYLFQLYEETYNDSIELKFMLIQFYLAHLPNKIKLSLIIASIQIEQLSWSQRLIFFGFNRRIQQLEIVTDLVVDTSKTDDQYTEFKKLMANAVNCFQQFWGKILQQKVDINQLMVISQKLFPLKKSIEQSWKKHINSQTFSSWSILKAYTYYRKNIMHDYTNSAILEGYCQIIEKRLQSKHQMSYISSETEQAVITISLTQSSLGNISSLNNQICKMFNFPRKSEMLDLRVNDIMPSVFSVLHDNILNSFLKNRFKEINQDQRSVFGKNKNGFIFPMLLQLRKLSWNLNDQLIFIAQVQLPKTRSAPILCISDLEGEIQDYTSTFAWLFVKKIRNNSTIKKKNIQEMIPNFFEFIEDFEGQIKKIHFYDKIICNKMNQKMQIQFNASELFIKKQKVGYLIEGTHLEHLQTLHEKRNITEVLASLYEENQIYTNTYNPQSHTYEVVSLNQSRKLSNQFSIPFLRTSDIQNVFQFKEKSKNYAQKIKICRLFQGRLQHVPEQDSFHSDEENFQAKEFSVIKRIQKLKEQLSVAQKSHLGNNFKITIIVISLLLLMMLGILISRVSAFDNTELQQIQNYNSKLNVRELFSEYLIYTFYPQSESKSRVLALRDQLQLNIVNSHIEQTQKQQLLQLIFSTQYAKTLSLNPLLLTFNYQQDEIYSGIVIIWQVTTVMCFVYVVALILIYFLFKLKIANIYSIFVSIDEAKIINIKQQAKQLLEILTFKNLQSFKKVTTQNLQKEDLGEAEFHRIKKMKNSYSFDDLGNISKLILPAFTILLYSIFCCIFVAQDLDNYKSFLKGWQQSSELLPSSSIKLMQSLINQYQIGNISIQSSYLSLEKQFQYKIVSGIQGSQGLLQILKGDICSNQLFYESIGINATRFCLNSTIFLQYSFSNLINYMSSMLSNQNGTIQSWSQLIQIEFGLLKPLLTYFSKMLQVELTSLRDECERNILILGVIFMCIVIVAWVYILYYPIQNIYERILFTTDLIKVLPTNQQKNPEYALAAITTEAMELS